jgi:cell division protein FtsZ
MDEVGTITDFVQNMAGFEADLIWGNGKDESLGDSLSVTLIATGFGKSIISEYGEVKKEIKETHLLNFNNPVSGAGNPAKGVAKKQFFKREQKTIEFDISEEKEKQEASFESLYPKTSKERKGNIENTRIDFASVSDEDLEDLENIPAYKRRQLRMNDPRYKKDLSNYAVTKENKISDKNSYLHDQVD